MASMMNGTFRRSEAPTTRLSDKTRAALLEAATEVFATEGFEGARVETIARRAGVNKAMINYHFGGKEALYETILVSTFSDFGERLRRIRDGSVRADTQLGDFIRAFAEMVSSRPSLPAMVLREVLSGGRHLSDRVMPHFLGVFAHVREIVQQGVREGTFRPVNPFLTHLTLIGCLAFFYATTPLRKRLAAEGRLPAATPSSEEFARHLQELMARGLAAERG